MFKSTFSLAFAFALLCTGAISTSWSLETGIAAPDFTLVDTHGKSHSLADFKGKTIVLEWTNPGCPFVVKHYGSGNMQALQKEYTAKGVVWLSLCSSAPGKQGHMSPEDWNKTLAKEGSTPTALLLDGEGKVGKLYGAKTTPHMFVIDAGGRVVYEGAIDSVKSPNAADIPKATNHVKAALDEVLAGKPVTLPVTTPYGCSVKYGN